jgi:hypothetical protein
MLASGVVQWLCAKMGQEGMMLDVFCLIFALSAIVLFSVLAARAEGKMWREISRHNGERRELQRQITLGKSHLR